MIEKNNGQYLIQNGSATLIKYNGNENTVILPEYVAGAALKRIAPGAFAGNASTEYRIKRKHVWEEEGDGAKVGEIILPDTVEELGEGAFARCKELGNVKLPEGLTRLPDYLFSDCRKLLPPKLPDTIRELGDYAFQNCRNITGFTLPENLKKIGNYAFYNCRRLKRLQLPKNVTVFGTGAFKNCEALSDISLEGHTNLQNVVADIHHAFTVSMKYTDEQGNQMKAKLFFTEEACEYIEDYPARQFHQVNYGTGHLYRQCIRNTDMDYQRYDEIFPVAVREEPFAQVVEIAKLRLRYPYSLKMDKQKEYLWFFNQNLIKAMELLFFQEDLESVEALANVGLFTAENIDDVTNLAIAKNKAAIASFLMDYRHKNSKSVKKSFDL